MGKRPCLARLTGKLVLRWSQRKVPLPPPILRKSSIFEKTTPSYQKWRRAHLSKRHRSIQNDFVYFADEHIDELNVRRSPDLARRYFRPGTIPWKKIGVDPNVIFATPSLLPSRPKILTSPTYAGLSKVSLRRLYLRWFQLFSQVSSSCIAKRNALNVNLPQPHFKFERLLKKRLKNEAADTPVKNLVIDTWDELGPRKQRQHWMSALLYSLHQSAPLASRFLLRTLEFDKFCLPLYAASDSISLICVLLLHQHGRAREGKLCSSKKDINTCLNLATRFLKQYPGCHRHGSFSRYIIGLIARHADGVQLEQWIKQLLSNSHLLTASDILYLAVQSTKRGKVGLALDLLRRLSPRQIERRETTQACTNMLVTDFPPDREHAVRTGMLVVMLELGVRADEYMRDVIIRNAMLAGDRATAWKSHDEAIKNGLEPSAVTYIYLLKGVEHGDTLRSVFSVYRAARQAGLTKYSVNLGAALIRAVFQALKSENKPRRYEIMLAMYAEVFDLQPLIDLRIVRKTKMRVNHTRLSPNFLTVQAMVTAWICECDSLNELHATYKRWFEWIDTSYAEESVISSSPHVYRAFIVRFNELGDTQTSIRIMRSLIGGKEGRLSTANREFCDEPGAPESAVSLVKLDVKTWTAFAHILARNGQSEDADKALIAMRAQGINPDAMTYEVLLHAYAKSQNIAKAVGILEQKQEAGYEADSWTLMAMSKIHDRKKLSDALSKVRFGHSQHRQAGSHGGHDQVDPVV